MAVLVPTEGTVISVRDFARQHLELISPYEQEMLRKGLSFMPSEVPLQFSAPLRIENDGEGIPVQKLGRRSAYDPVSKIKFKACMPTRKDVPYANRSYPFGDNSFRVMIDHFGGMDALHTLREIMAINFLCQQEMPNSLHPLCVFSYTGGGEPLGYSIVMSNEFNERMHAMDPDKNEKQQTIMRLALFDTPLFRKLIDHEKNIPDRKITETIAYKANDAGLSIEGYIQRETEKLRQEYDKPWSGSSTLVAEANEKHIDLLLAMHFRGLFRDSANAHQGNTIVSPVRDYFFCDFETAFLIPIPRQPDEHFLRDFYLASVIEAMDLDFLYMSFLPHPDLSKTQENRRNAFEEVFKKYQEVSLLYRGYHEQFFTLGEERGWNMNTLEQAVQKAQQTPVFMDQVLLRICNDFTLAYYPFSNFANNPFLLEQWGWGYPYQAPTSNI